MFDTKEFPGVYAEFTTCVRVNRDLAWIKWWLYSHVTSEDCCIFIACHIERLIQIGEFYSQGNATDVVEDIVWGMVPDRSEASKFAEKYTEGIMKILQ